MKRSPMKRGAIALKRTPMKRSRPKKRDAAQEVMKDVCRGQPCYLQLPCIICSGIDTVVPAHANWADYGKGMGIRSFHGYTIPACFNCHRELDQGHIFSKQEKRDFWESAYAKWVPVRAFLLNQPE